MRNMLVGLSSALLLGFAAQGARADGVADSIAELKTLVKKSEDVKAIDLMTKLADLPDPQVTRTLVDLTDSDRIDVACAAYRLAAPRKDPVFFAKLKTRMGNKKLAEASPKTYEEVIDALAVYADRSSLDALEDAMPRYLATNADFTTRIVRAYATVREKRVVEKLLKWMLDSESTEGYTTSKTAYPDASKEAKANYAKVHEEIVKQLGQLTGQKFADLKGWKTWWKTAEGTFKFPAPPKK